MINNFSYPVILDDDRDAHVSWEHHLERGSAGGVDLAYPLGSTVRANAAGRFLYVPGNGSGGNMGLLYIDHPVLARIEYLHLSKRIANGDVQQGDDLALSGASGFGNPNYYGPHLHVHAYTRLGARVNIFDYFPDASTAGNGERESLEDDMTPEQANQLESIYKALFSGGGDAGPKALINRVADIEARVTNIDQQVTGADGFDNPNGSQQSVAGRVIDIQKNTHKS